MTAGAGELGADVGRTEGVLAAARLYLAVASLVALWLDPTEPSRYARLAYLLLLAYAIVSALLLLALRDRFEPGAGLRLAIHVLDILWAAVLSLLTEGPNSPFFLFFGFVLIAAAYRWGSRGSLATVAVIVALLSVQATLMSRHGRWLGVEGDFEINRFLMRGVYLVIMAHLLGHLGDAERRLRWEAAATARVLARIPAEGGIGTAVRALFEELVEIFRARRVLLALREQATGRVFLWEGRSAGAGSPVATGVSEVDEAVRRDGLLAGEGQAWAASRIGGSEAFDIVAFDGGGQRHRSRGAPLPANGLGREPFGSALAVSLEQREGWAGRLFLLDPLDGRAGDRDLTFLERLMNAASPVLRSAELLRRLRSRVGAVERARVARELHDGVIQSLIGLEMQVDVLRRQAQEREYASAGALTHIQALLRDEILTVRELMQQMRAVDVKSVDLLDHLVALVERFRNETGISARFVSDLEEPNLSPRLCREVVRVVQEALVNVRKHSGARNVVVRLDREGDRWLLVIDDDGRGFGFSGRLSQRELDLAHKGPVVIKERVRASGGDIAIESQAGSGSRIEIRLPDRADA